MSKALRGHAWEASGRLGRFWGSAVWAGLGCGFEVERPVKTTDHVAGVGEEPASGAKDHEAVPALKPERLVKRSWKSDSALTIHRGGGRSADE